MLRLLLVLGTVWADLTVRLKAQWPAPTQPSLLQEIAEYLWDYDQASFWSFVDRAHSSMTLESAVASLGRSDSESRLLTTSLYMREFAPRLEVHAQLAAAHRGSLQCAEFFYLPQNRSYCDFPETSERLDGTSALFPFDHVDAAKAQNVSVIVHYRDIGNEGSRGVRELAREKGFVYVLRHIDLRNHSDTDSLAGYGVQLLIKNMEYAHVENPQSVLSGFDFDVLRARFPEEKEKLQELHSYLEQRDDWNRPLKNWELKGTNSSELSIKTAQSLVSLVKASGSLSSAYDFLRNFPDHSIPTATKPISTEFRAEVENNARLLTYVRDR